MNLEPGLKAKQPLNLMFRQHSGPIGLYRQRFKSLTRDIRPSAFESG